MAPGAMADDTAKAKTAQQDFLTLWKDADPDISILSPRSGNGNLRCDVIADIAGLRS